LALNTRGQVLVIAIAIFACLVLAALGNLYYPRPRIVHYVGELQTSTIVQILRVYIANRSSYITGLSNASMDINNIFYRLTLLNNTCKLNIPEVTPDDILVRMFWRNCCHLALVNLRYKYFNSTVIVNVTWSYIYLNNYTKNIGELTLTYMNFTLTCSHTYITPQYNVTIHPCLYDTLGLADIKLVDRDKGVWIVGVPYEGYPLKDEYNIVIRVGS